MVWNVFLAAGAPVEHAAIQILLLLLIGCLTALIARRYKVPYTLALVVTGFGLGMVEIEELEVFHLTAEVLFTFLLPALLFEAAFHLDIADFRRNARAILTLALVGVSVSAGLTGLLLWLAAVPTGLAPTLSTAVVGLFAVVIAATDPISVLALFKTLGVPRRLYLLVEGESLLNDGVAVVLFLIVAAVFGVEVGHGAHVELHGTSEIVIYGLKTFVTMAGGGVLIGAGLGALFSGLMRQFDDHLVEITLTTVVAFGSFLLAEELHCSGVLSTVTAGIVTGSFGAKYGMSTRTRLAVEDFWEYAAFVANTIVFLLMGLVLRFEDLVADAGLIAVAFLATVLARAVSTYSAWPVLRAAGQDLPWAWSHVLVWGGLRGSLSMVLVLGIAPDFPGRETLIHLVFGVVSASLFLQGLTVGPLLARLGLSSGADPTRTDADAERARIFGIVAAEHQLHELVAEGIVDAEECERLTHWLEARRQQAETALSTQSDSLRESERTADTLIRLLDVEREAIRHAVRLEIIDGAAAERALAELDRRVAKLRDARHHGHLAESLTTLLDEEATP
jgi:CPA1 family monovalent cation:H+ antiporter